MDIAKGDLERLVTAVQMERGDGEWTVASSLDGGTDRCRYFVTRDGSYEDYYFYDQEGVNHSGDTALHRLASLQNLPTMALKTFLRHRDQHFYEFVHSRRGSPLSCILRGNCHYVDLPHPPRLDQQNKMGSTFLHVAVYRNSANVVEIAKVAMEAHRNLASLPMKCGSYPIHIACANNVIIRADLWRSLIESDPLVLLKEDLHGDNPLSLLWKNVLRFSWARRTESGQRIVCRDGDLSHLSLITPERYWHFSLFLVRYTKSMLHCRQQHQNLPFSQYISIHDIVSMPRCPPLLVRLALWNPIWAGDANTRDFASGKLALHYAAAAKPFDASYIPPHAGNVNTKSIIQILLEANPRSAFVKDYSGRIPLHYAIESGVASAADLFLLWNAYPGGMRVQDPVTKLYPFMLLGTRNPTDAAVAVAVAVASPRRCSNNFLSEIEQPWKTNQVDTAFIMLQRCPEVVSYHAH